MGFFAAVGACYANMFNFTGRARRAEYWWFFLFQTLVACGMQVAVGFLMTRDPALLAALADPKQTEAQFEALLRGTPQFWTWMAWGFAAQVIFLWVPHLSVTFRRLHDTGRSAWYILMPLAATILAAIGMFVLAGMSAIVGQGAMALAIMMALVPLVASIWFIVVLCLPGTRGNNPWGSDPVPYEQRRASGDHPAFQRDLDPKTRREIEAIQKAQFQEYYQSRVLPAIQKNRTNRV